MSGSPPHQPDAAAQSDRSKRSHTNSRDGAHGSGAHHAEPPLVTSLNRVIPSPSNFSRGSQPAGVGLSFPPQHRAVGQHATSAMPRPPLSRVGAWRGTAEQATHAIQQARKAERRAIHAQRERLLRWKRLPACSRPSLLRTRILTMPPMPAVGRLYQKAGKRGFRLAQDRTTNPGPALRKNVKSLRDRFFAVPMIRVRVAA